MKRIAILFAGDIHNRKGLINAVLERAIRMQNDPTIQVEIFCIMEREGWLVRMLRKHRPIRQQQTEIVDGLRIQLLWKPFTLLDYLLLHKVQRKPWSAGMWYHRVARRFDSFDLILAHSWEAGLIAMDVKQRLGIPYIVTWHGSDIHTFPFSNRFGAKIVRQLLEDADRNFFVSRALLEDSKRLSDKGSERIVSYNGVSERFVRYSPEKRMQLRSQYGVPEGAKVIAFVGGLVPIKQVGLLPDIYGMIQSKSHDPLCFWVIGDGKLRSELVRKLADVPNGLSCKLWGDQPTEEIPLLMNCIDLLVLPSLNEGLPLVVVEALRSGANVVASEVGGIKEVIGQSCVVPLGDRFVERFSDTCLRVLRGEQSTPPLPPVFDWNIIVAKELDYVSQTLSHIK